MHNHFHLLIGIIVDIICFLASIFGHTIAPILLISAANVPKFQIAAACAGIAMFLYTVIIDQYRHRKNKKTKSRR